MTPVTWRLRREGSTGTTYAPSVTHLTQERPGDVRVGSFPLLCGRWAPDGLDAIVEPVQGRKTCQRCAKAAR